jgi:hypothetical protein
VKQYEAVIKTMEANGGYATLGFLNQEVFKVANCEWKTRTPFASVRRIVQDERYFFKIRPGLWALKSYKDRLPQDILPTTPQARKAQIEYNHSYYQGLLVEMGNLKKFDTFVPNQDKNKPFLGKKLCDIVTLTKVYSFCYDSILKRAGTVDVLWFNRRKMPSKIFEVEHTTDIQNSLLKFVDLQDFFVDFFIVADSKRKYEFENKLSYGAFVDIKSRTKFMSYNDLSELHTKTFQTISIESQYNLDSQ